MPSADRQEERQSKVQRSQGQEGRPSKLGKHALGPGSRERTLTLLGSAPGLYLSVLGGTGWASVVSLATTRQILHGVLGNVTAHAQQATLAPGPPIALRNPSREISASFPHLLNDRYLPFASCLLHGQRKMCTKE